MGRGSAGAGAKAAAQKASSPAHRLSDAKFADAAMSAARSAGADLGGRKVFIDRAYDHFARTPEGKGVTLDAFKERLAQANRDRRVDLVALDLVEAFPQAQVRRSMTTLDKGVTVNFILIK